MSLKDYIPSEMVVVVGAITVDNFESLTVEKLEDNWSFSSGSGGEETRTANASKRTRFTLELPQTNEANAYLATLAGSKSTTNISIVDPNGLSVHACARASVMKPATATYQKMEASTRTWELVGPADLNVSGGN